MKLFEEKQVKKQLVNKKTMNKIKKLNQIRLRRKRRTRAKIKGTIQRPRLSVFRSNRYTYAQLIDDEKGHTLVSASSRDFKNLSKVEAAKKVGEIIGEKALNLGIKEAVFDRGSYKYHGRVKAVAEGAREKGLKI